MPAEPIIANECAKSLTHRRCAMRAPCHGSAFAPPRVRSDIRGFAFGCLQGAYNFGNRSQCKQKQPRMAAVTLSYH
jgi:hypothetical protein